MINHKLSIYNFETGKTKIVNLVNKGLGFFVETSKGLQNPFFNDLIILDYDLLNEIIDKLLDDIKNPEAENGRFKYICEVLN